MTGSYTDYSAAGRIRDCVNHRLVCNALCKVLKNRGIEAPLLDPVLREVDLGNRNRAAAACSVDKSDGAGCAGTDSYRVRRVSHSARIQYDPSKVVKPGYEKVCPAPAGSAVDLSFWVNIERSDVTLVVGNRGSHARQARRKRDHRAFAHELVPKLVLIGFYRRRIGVKSALCLHSRNLPLAPHPNRQVRIFSLARSRH